MPWYHHFFCGLPQQAWREAQTDDQTQYDLELIVETLSFGPGDQILDVFCGYGRHALPLARMGATVTGVDISAEYIAELQATALREQLSLTAIAADFLTTSELNGKAGQFDAAYCLGNSFAFFPPDDMVRFLHRTAQLLKPDGRLLVQSGLVAEVILPDFQERNWMPIGETMTLLVENQYEPMRGQLNQQLTYLQVQNDGSTIIEQRNAQYHVYTIAQVIEMMQQVGLTVEDLYGTVDQQPFMIGDEGMWLVAHKKKDHK